MPTNHLIIKGKVQGVFYRASAREEAKKLGVVGWIKNTADGNVEALVSGTDSQLEAFFAWCRQGPRNARVTNVIISPAEEKAFEKFTVIRD